IDALIVASALGLFAWAAVLAPFVRDADVSMLERQLAVGYSVLTMALVAVTTRLAVGPGLRTPAYYFLAGSVGVIFVADALSTLDTTGRLDTDLAALLAPVPYLLAGVAVLHPSMRRLTERPEHVATHLTRRRLAMLAAALLAAPVVLVVQLTGDQEADLPVVVSGTVVLSLLVLARLASLVRATERAAERERVLRDTGSALVAAGSRDETALVALEGVLALTNGLPAGRASVLDYANGWFEVAASVGRQSSGIVGRRIAAEGLPKDVLAAMEQRRAIALEGLRSFDADPGAEPETEASIVVAPLVTRGELRGAIVVVSAAPIARAVVVALWALATEVSLALESAALAEEMHRRRGERRFRALVENSAEVILVVDDDRRATFASPAVNRVLGRPEAYFLGELPADLVHRLDRARLDAVLRAAESNTSVDPVEVRLLHGDGAYRWFEVSASDLRNEPEVAGLVITARDISDRKAAELRVARSEARFRALVQSSSDVVAVIDERGFFTYVSPAVAPLLGFRPDELVGTNVLRLLPPEEVSHAMGLLTSVDASPFEQVNLEIRLRERGGDWRHVDVTISDLRHEPAVQGIVLNARD
ncbi:MAG TPA: PAS domain-containing protein, partial [Acidimicrobiales bacterium]|nr:PAS domain-containing protein [Acidimicrobiales bacterium]